MRADARPLHGREPTTFADVADLQRDDGTHSRERVRFV